MQVGLPVRATIFGSLRDPAVASRRPPFATLDAETRLGAYLADPILVIGDDITTDHISPAGAVPAGSEAARYLVERGEDPRDLNVFSSRRGNWEAMVRGLFTNKTVKNLLGDGIPPGSTIFTPTGEVLPLWQAAERYRTAGRPVVIVAGERYGMGSSRDWAAKGASLLGTRAVLATSFERITARTSSTWASCRCACRRAWGPWISPSGPETAFRSMRIRTGCGSRGNPRHDRAGGRQVRGAATDRGRGDEPRSGGAPGRRRDPADDPERSGVPEDVRRGGMRRPGRAARPA